MQFCRIDKRMAQKMGEFSFIPKNKVCPTEAERAAAWVCPRPRLEGRDARPRQCSQALGTARHSPAPEAWGGAWPTLLSPSWGQGPARRQLFPLRL